MAATNLALLRRRPGLRVPSRRLSLFSSITLVLASGRLLGTPGLEAQELWTEASTLGYAAAGVGLATAAIWDSDCSACALSAGFAVAAGGLAFGIGHLIGSGAEAAADRGERPSGAQLMGVRMGTVLAGASLGAMAGGIYINRKGVKEPGRDERDFVILTVTGALLGAWVEYRQEAWLRETAATDLALLVGPTAVGSWVLGLTLVTR